MIRMNSNLVTTTISMFLVPQSLPRCCPRSNKPVAALSRVHLLGGVYQLLMFRAAGSSFSAQTVVFPTSPPYPILKG
jgi:hypothetical protein